MRLLVSGLNAPECEVLATTAGMVIGSRLQVVTSPPTEQRTALFEGFDPDDPSLSVVRENLDGLLEAPLLVSGCPAWHNDEALEMVVNNAVEAHISAYGLCEPICPSTSWDPRRAELDAYWAIDGAVVTTGDGSASWWDVSEVVTFDGVVDDALRASLLSLLCAAPDWDAETGVDPRMWERGIFTDVTDPSDGDEEQDGEARGAGWGLCEEGLAQLCAAPAPGPIAQLEERIARLLHEANEGCVRVSRMATAVFGDSVTPLAANAPVASDGDLFSWHIDADPMLLPPSPWTDVFGRAPNRAPGKPRFVTALIYLNEHWDSKWGGPTRFLDLPTERVLHVTPKPGRVVLMDQDITHAVTAPSTEAGDRPRYSLACKLVLYPGSELPGVLGQRACDGTTRLRLVHPKFGKAALFGSAQEGGEDRTLSEQSFLRK